MLISSMIGTLISADKTSFIGKKKNPSKFFSVNKLPAMLWHEAEGKVSKLLARSLKAFPSFALS